ncbi:MAG: hypothetical protein GF364_03030 [Candidatus Lokiarchaeota archaeon]|nr:hypothetical protein [Candidatus Lokiarchaeota archaeon]
MDNIDEIKFNTPDGHTTAIASKTQSFDSQERDVIFLGDKLNSDKLKERDLVILLKKQLDYKFKSIFIHKNPTKSDKAKRFLLEELGYIPSLQPEIDMIFVANNESVNAIEVKLIKSNDVKPRARYYKGFDQSIALYRYGFDNVGLWHIFTSDISIDTINKFGAQTWYFIRNVLKLPLDFSYYRLIKQREKIKFQVLQYTEENKGFVLSKTLDDPEFEIEWRYGNPILNDPMVRVLRESLNSYIHFE